MSTSRIRPSSSGRWSPSGARATTSCCRSDARTGEPWLKKLVAATGYKVINKIADVKIPPNTGDFRLMSRRVVTEVVRLKESHGFLRGIVAVVGFKQAIIPLRPPAPLCGRDQLQPLLRLPAHRLQRHLLLLHLRADQLSTMAGLHHRRVLVPADGHLPFLQAHGLAILWGNPTLVILISFLGGIQLISVGILGEYIGRIYEEVRGRPKFIVDQSVGFGPSR
jgi:hypothetical protein